jgi:hypothetical protein
LKINAIFISFPHYVYQKVSSGRYKICWNRILITNKEIQLSAADGAKDTAEEFELLYLKEGIYCNIQRAAVLGT